MYKSFDEKTQGYIDKTLDTLNTWFGASSPFRDNQTQGQQGGQGQQGQGGQIRQRPPQEEKKPKTGLYVGLGIGILAITGLTIYLVKKSKK